MAISDSSSCGPRPLGTRTTATPFKQEFRCILTGLSIVYIAVYKPDTPVLLFKLGALVLLYNPDSSVLQYKPGITRQA